MWNLVNKIISLFASKAQLQDYTSILSLSAPDIQRMTKLSVNDIHLLKSAVAHKIHRIPYTTGKCSLLLTCLYHIVEVTRKEL